MRTHKFCTVLFSVTVDWYKQVDACCYQHTPAILIYWQLYISHVKIHVTSAAWCHQLTPWSKFVDNTQYTTSKQDIGRKSWFFHNQPAFDASIRGDSHQNTAIRFGAQKLEWCGYPMLKKFKNMSARCDTIHETRQTDGHGLCMLIFWLINNSDFSRLHSDCV